MVKKWEIYYLDLDPTKGSEQKGTRPILVISNDAVNSNLPVFTCIPFSSVKPGAKIYPTEVFLSTEDSGLPKDSVLMLQQIRTVSIDRIYGNRIGEIKDEEIKAKINQALTLYFELG
jgi:mRNA interferase MazF